MRSGSGVRVLWMHSQGMGRLSNFKRHARLLAFRTSARCQRRRRWLSMSYRFPVAPLIVRSCLEDETSSGHCRLGNLATVLGLMPSSWLNSAIACKAMDRCIAALTACVPSGQVCYANQLPGNRTWYCHDEPVPWCSLPFQPKNQTMQPSDQTQRSREVRWSGAAQKRSHFCVGDTYLGVLPRPSGPGFASTASGLGPRASLVARRGPACGSRSTTSANRPAARSAARPNGRRCPARGIDDGRECPRLGSF
ncbi:hypothetical protein TRM7615_00978 [Falsiruegeria mediterranea M17]|uniref:Uncharacterized protein n=1 Tax=Falsiruegeria mediterranea M17 TaxID=1200281 RepID=A0A2R8C4Y6_9RHOB|nr:hypothetical protein TRM7615_00978 [Falsiruegeria mediterranea M17]